MCAHLYERKFRAKPFRDCEPSEYANQVAAESCGALDNCQRHAVFVRTNETSVLGVSEHLQLDHGAKKGGWQRGSLTPQMPPSLPRTAASTETRAAQSAARFTAAKWFKQKDIDTWTDLSAMSILPSVGL